MATSNTIKRKATVQKVEFSLTQRILVISDIHGNLPFLQGVLKKAKFTPEDVLIIVGDMIEKGKQTLETIRYIRKLQETHQVYPLPGNYEEMFRLFLEKDFSRKERFLGMLKFNKNALAYQLSGRSWSDSPDFLESLRESVLENPETKEILQWISQMPTILDTPKYTFVHGGVPTLHHMEQLDHWRCLKKDHFLWKDLHFPKYVVVGHAPTTLYRPHIQSDNPLIDEEKHIICLDGACVIKRDGQLNCFIIQQNKHHWVSYDGFPTVTAKTPQAPTKNSINIRWGSHAKVKILEYQGELTYCNYREKVSNHGRKYKEHRLKILTSYLKEQPPQGILARCNDFSNYFLPVESGDTLTLIEKVEGGFYGKKEGVVGWYLGEYEEREDEPC